MLVLPSRYGKSLRCSCFTGYSVHGGYAEFAQARADFTFPLPSALDDLQAAPLLCAGIIGFRSLRVAEVKRGERVGLFGFGASAPLAIAVLRAMELRGLCFYPRDSHRQGGGIARRDVGWPESEKPPVKLDRAVDFRAQRRRGSVRPRQLAERRVVAINAIHLDRIPEFDYDRLLWGERQIRSVTNMTRADARDFLQLAARSIASQSHQCSRSIRPMMLWPP